MIEKWDPKVKIEITIDDALKIYTFHKNKGKIQKIALHFGPKLNHGKNEMEQPWSQTHNLLSFHVYVSPTAKALSPSQSRMSHARPVTFRATNTCACHSYVKSSDVCFMMLNRQTWNGWVKWKNTLYMGDVIHDISIW